MTELLSATSAKVGIWLINLPQSKDRLSKMEAQLQILGIDYTLFEAIDGRADWSNLCLNVDIPRFEKKRWPDSDEW